MASCKARARGTGTCPAADLAPAGDLRVGFVRWTAGDEPFFFCNKQAVYQAALLFDLDEIPSRRKLISSAELRLTQDMLGRAHGADLPLFVPGCIGEIATVKEDWSAKSGLVANDDLTIVDGEMAYDDVVRATVTHPVVDWAADPDSNLGFVVKGFDEAFTEDDQACVSNITSAELVVTYVDFPDVPVVFSR
ncbi:MAG TPA: hypothetical protein VFD92_14700 [Candidatus Binatia bacterium]|nr:hypothetical protein [Candidatus Binatia bacterium]